MTKTTANVLVLGVLCVAGALPALACGGGNKPAATEGEPSESSALGEKSSTPTASAAATASAAPSAAAPEATPLAQVLETDAAAIAKIFDAMSAAPQVTLQPKGLAGKDPLAAGVKDTSKKLTAGMKPEGPLGTGKLAEKGHLRAEFTLAAGKCYSILGFSPTVTDLDLYLLVPPGILSGQDLTDDNKPIIGGPPQPMCPTEKTPVTYKLDIFADKGAGDIAVQLFSKAN
jgi:hypothetical protein